MSETVQIPPSFDPEVSLSASGFKKVPWYASGQELGVSGSGQEDNIDLFASSGGRRLRRSSGRKESTAWSDDSPETEVTKTGSSNSLKKLSSSLQSLRREKVMSFDEVDRGYQVGNKSENMLE